MAYLTHEQHAALLKFKETLETPVSVLLDPIRKGLLSPERIERMAKDHNCCRGWLKPAGLRLEGEPHATLKLIDTEGVICGEIRLVPEPDRGLTAHWNLHMSTLVRKNQGDGSGGRI